MIEELKDKVFVALVEVSPLHGSFLDPLSVGGAAVRCYVLAPNEDVAMVKLNDALIENRLQHEETVWCVDSAAVEWDNPDSASGRALVEDAKASGKVIFSEFHAWER